jgi:hypothetical protein
MAVQIMDIVKYMVLQLAVTLNPESPEQAIMYAEEMLDWLQEDNPVVDEEGDMEVIFTPEGEIH